MSTLKKEDLAIMEKQIEDAKGKMIPKDEVIRIIQERLKYADSRNPFIVDRIDSAAIKEVLNNIIRIR